MMMPANFTAVNSEVVYGGASLLDTLGDMAAPVWNASNVRTFNTNILTILSNTFTQGLINSTIGTMFGGNWGKDGVKLTGDDGSFSNFMKNQIVKNADGTYTTSGDEMNGLNKFMRAVGVLASVYTLGTTSAKVSFNDSVTGFTPNI